MACDPNTLLSSGAAFQGLDERSQLICIAQLLCDIGSSVPLVNTGTVDPNGVYTAIQGSIYNQFDGSNNFIKMWIKSGSGNTGWS